MRIEAPFSWQPLAWYLGITVAVPLLDGASAGEHVLTTVVVSLGFFVLLACVGWWHGGHKTLSVAQRNAELPGGVGTPVRCVARRYKR